MNPEDPVEVDTYSLGFDLLPLSSYEFRVVAETQYGESWDQIVYLETPEAAPDLTSFFVTNTFVNTTLHWTFEVDALGATDITQYSISRNDLKVKL